MAIVKCLNPECDYFEKTVPEGDCCPYCGELLNADTPSPQSQPIPQSYPPISPQVFSTPPPQKAPIATVVESIDASLKLIHQSGRVFDIKHHQAIEKIYLGRQDGLPSDRPVVDIVDVPFAERISRFHAALSWNTKENTYTIADNNSTNGTILNGKVLIPQQTYPLHTGDRLELGREQKLIFTIEIN